MKKLLLLVLIALLLALNIYVVFNGLGIGSISILGVKGIQDKNDELDTTIEQTTKLASTDYPKALSNIETDTKKLQTEKKNYEDMVTISSSDDVATAKQLTKYNIEFLWTKLGNHATSEGVTIKIDVTKGTNTTQETYNLNFTANGSYIGISDFISSVENDSQLGFKIEDFKMVPNTDTTDLQATFVCKDIAIIDISNTQVNTTVTNNTNTTNTNTNTNTANTNSNTKATNTNSNSTNTNKNNVANNTQK